MTTPTPPATDDFLDDEAYATPRADMLASRAPSRRRIPAVSTAGWLVAGVAVGAIGVAALHSNASGSTTTNPAAATGSLPNGTAPNGTVPNATVPNGGLGPNGGGGFDGEQRLQGTLRSVNGTTFTLATDSGTSTYTIDSSTQLVKDGQQVSSLSAMNVGDQVLVHVYPLNGRTHVERVIDGGFGGFGGPDDNQVPPTGQGSAQTT